MRRGTRTLSASDAKHFTKDDFAVRSFQRLRGIGGHWFRRKLNSASKSAMGHVTARLLAARCP